MLPCTAPAACGGAAALRPAPTARPCALSTSLCLSVSLSDGWPSRWLTRCLSWESSMKAPNARSASTSNHRVSQRPPAGLPAGRGSSVIENCGGSGNRAGTGSNCKWLATQCLRMRSALGRIASGLKPASPQPHRAVRCRYQKRRAVARPPAPGGYWPSTTSSLVVALPGGAGRAGRAGATHGWRARAAAGRRRSFAPGSTPWDPARLLKSHESINQYNTTTFAITIHTKGFKKKVAPALPMNSHCRGGLRA